MKNRNLLITFDYELFLGSRSGQPDGCVLRPTKLLSEVMSRHKARGVFFVDTTYLLTLRELSAGHPACKNDYANIARQLVTLVDKGHYVFPHMHPHWLDAIYIPEKHEFNLLNTGKYRFNSLSTAERDKVFDGSMEILQEILLPQHPSYKINAFRAGGWCIQPFSDFAPYFDKHGIIYDMSVMSGLYQFSTAQQFDFSTAPRKNVYRFSDDVCVEDQNGKYIQICGSIIDLPAHFDFFHKIHRKVINRTGQGKEYGSGQGQVPAAVTTMKPAGTTGYDINARGREFASLEKAGIVKLPVYTRHLNASHYLHLISHPKAINPHQVYVLDKLLESVNRDGNVETDYMKIAECYLHLN